MARVTTTRKDARIAGLFYMLMVLTGPFVVIYVPGKLFVPGDAAETAANILAHQSLFQAFIVVGLFSELFFIATALALYRLLRNVWREAALLMVILVLLEAPLAFSGVADQIATLSLVRSPDLLSAFDPAQRDVLATLMISIEGRGSPVSELFWGLWLLPLALLVYRSAFLPRFLGVWLFLNGLVYVIISFTGILLPEHAETVSTVTLPVLMGEVVFALWLLVIGAGKGPGIAEDPDGRNGRWRPEGARSGSAVLESGGS
ncbi:MAG: DUF4386 domain-containing protein [Gemmatimonadota bacterium]|nr:DUF4386 domain-containing protein [Gemmatimonadota bacterium]